MGYNGEASVEEAELHCLNEFVQEWMTEQDRLAVKSIENNDFDEMAVEYKKEKMLRKNRLQIFTTYLKRVIILISI